MEIKGLNINNDINIVSNVEWVHSALERLLSINMNEMIGALDTGTRLHDFIHERITEKDVMGMLNEITNLIKYNMPMIFLEGIGVEVTEESGTIGLIITIEFSFIDNSDEIYVDKIYKTITI